MLFYFVFLLCSVSYCVCENCGPGWIYRGRTHSCYSTAFHPLRWADAQNYCRQKGNESNLVSVLSEEERVIVQDLIDDEFFSWVGLSRLPAIPPPSQVVSDFDWVYFGDTSSGENGNEPEPSGTDPDYISIPTEAQNSGLEAEFEGSGEEVFRWTDGSSFEFEFFQPGEPSNKGDCVAWSVGDDKNGWKTISCNYSQFFVCKKPAESQNPPVVLKAPEGSFTSPGFPERYEDDLEQLYYIEVEENQRIVLEIYNVDTEQNIDTVTIYDGRNENARTMARLSGQEENLAFLSSGPAVHIIFRSDRSSGGQGFNASYRTWTEPELIRLGEPGAVITSNNYPYSIPQFTIQEYLIECPTEHHIHFNVTEVNTLEIDRLLFFSGSTSMHDVLQSFSGKMSSLPLFFRSSGEAVFVQFKSGNQTSQRWRFGYDCVRLDGFGAELIID